nr:peptidyl-prolyl cis-trans isomerase [archaeon]
GYAVFGKITTGMDVVDKIASVRTGSRGMNRDWPVDDITIQRAYVKS